MCALMPEETRSNIGSTRKRPTAANQLVFPAASGGSFPEAGSEMPTDILVEATYPTGEVAEWFDDTWWTVAIERWGDVALTVHILPSRSAIGDPVVLHMMAMLKRIVPKWRLIGHAYASEIDVETGPDVLARSNYDEVRMVEGFRNCKHPGAGRRHVVRIEDLFARVRRAQQIRGATRPVTVRATSLPVVPGEVSAPPMESRPHSRSA